MTAVTFPPRLVVETEPAAELFEPKLTQQELNIQYRMAEVIRRFMELMAELSRESTDKSRALKQNYTTETKDIADYMATKKVPYSALTAIGSAGAAFLFAWGVCPVAAAGLMDAAWFFPRAQGFVAGAAGIFELCADNATAFASAGLQLGQSVGSTIPDATLKQKEGKASIILNDLQSQSGVGQQDGSIKDAALQLLNAAERLRETAARGG